MSLYNQHNIDCFHEYERVRSEGNFNMWDENARRATGLTSYDYTYVMANYSAIKAVAEKATA